MTIKVIRVDEIRICFQCKGKGFVEHTDHNLLERVTEKCDQCNGSGLLKLTGNIEISPFKSYNTTYHDTQK